MKDMKLKDKDVGFAEDSFSAMKQAVGEEEHCYATYINTRKKEDLEKLNLSRKLRSDLQDSILVVLQTELKNQEWCEMKHTCALAMHIQELIARCSSAGFYQIAEKFAECYKNLYLIYLKLLGVTAENISVSSSA